METNESGGHITTVKNDKCLLSDVPCLCIGKTKTTSGHEYSDKKVFYFPDEVFLSKDSNKKIFLIPIIPMNTDEPNRVPIPIFMLNFTNKQIDEIIYGAKILGIEIDKRYFNKPKITIAYEERFEVEELQDGENVMLNF